MIDYRPIPSVRVVPFIPRYRPPSTLGQEPTGAEAGAAHPEDVGAIFVGGLLRLVIGGSIAVGGIWTGINGSGLVRVAGWGTGVLGGMSALSGAFSMLTAPFAGMHR